MANLVADRRAVSAVVAKTLAAGLALVYIAGMTGIILGGIVPDYEHATGEELSERTLATAATTIEGAVPQANGTVNTTSTAELPPTIDGQRYQIELSDQTVSIVHPTEGIGQSTTLSLPPETTVENGTVASTEQLRVRVTGPATNRTVSLES